MKLMDLIVPVYFINHDFWWKNIESWIKELPINTIYFGLGNPQYDLEFFKEGLQENLLEEINYEVIDQRSIKTLGKCLADLMKHVQTEWFAFLHTDVFLTENCFSLMKTFMKAKYGIIESTRCFQRNKEEIPKTSSYYFRERAYSGFQIIQKKAIEDIIEKIEDDYVYRNEDFIFQNACKEAGFEYKKTWVMHYHQNQNIWSKDHKETHMMQWKGLIKYATPDSVCLDACIQAILVCMEDPNFDFYETLTFIQETNVIWKDSIFFYLACKTMKDMKKKI